MGCYYFTQNWRLYKVSLMYKNWDVCSWVSLTLTFDSGNQKAFWQTLSIFNRDLSEEQPSQQKLTCSK